MYYLYNAEFPETLLSVCWLYCLCSTWNDCVTDQIFFSELNCLQNELIIMIPSYSYSLSPTVISKCKVCPWRRKRQNKTEKDIQVFIRNWQKMWSLKGESFQMIVTGSCNIFHDSWKLWGYWCRTTGPDNKVLF